MILKHLILIVLVVLLGAILYYDAKFHYILVIGILSLCLLCIAFSFVSSYDALKKFINKLNIVELQNLELDLNNATYKYNDWFLTNNYIFGLRKMIMIRYDDIVSVKLSIGFSTMPSCRSGLIHKEIITLTDGKKYSFKIAPMDYPKIESFNKIVKSKNPNIK